MKKIGIVALTLIAALFVTASTSTLTAANSTPDKNVVIDFLRQFIAHATPVDMPMESRITTAISATQAQAEALGEEISADELEQIARNPQVFAPESDTFFTWLGEEWQAVSRSTYNYSSGKKNSVRTDHWTGVWNNYSLTSWTYSGNQIDYYTYQTWDGGASNWVNNTRVSFAYDGSNRISSMTIETWSGLQYNPASRAVYTYDGSSRVATITNQTWVGEWFDLSRTTYTYDGNGNETLALTETLLGTWTNSAQTISTYTGNLLMTETMQNWVSAAWSNSSKYEYGYDGSNRETLARYYLWQTAAWNLSDVDTTKYNGGGLASQTVHWTVATNGLTKEDYTYDGSGNPVLMIGQEFDVTWQNSSKVVFVYTTLATKVDGALLPKDFALLQNHPNPFNPTTTIRYNLGRSALVRIEIHNVLGQLVRVLENSEQSAGVYETNWDGRSDSGREVASGVYFYSLKAADYTETRKMVLSR